MVLQQKEKSFFETVKPWMSSIILLPFMLFFVYNEGKFNFIDYINLLIHEGGHGVFSFFGKFIYTLGGTLMQIIIPGMFVVYYLVIKKRVLVQIFLVWLGENLINISVYAADARAHKLSLLGGKKVYHDWTYLLNETGLILCDYEVGRFFYWLGVLVFIISFMMPLFLKEYEVSKVELKI
jgi:hypothetical protein